MKKSFKTRVYYYDTDKMGVVYHSNYLKWMEIARTEYFRDMPITYNNIEEMGYILAIRKVDIEYINSAKYDDIIEIFVEIKKIDNIKIEFYYEMYDEQKVLKAKGTTVNVFVDKEGNLKRIKKEMLEVLKENINIER